MCDGIIYTIHPALLGQGVIFLTIKKIWGSNVKLISSEAKSELSTDKRLMFQVSTA